VVGCRGWLYGYERSGTVGGDCRTITSWSQNAAASGKKTRSPFTRAARSRVTLYYGMSFEQRGALRLRGRDAVRKSNQLGRIPGGWCWTMAETLLDSRRYFIDHLR